MKCIVNKRYEFVKQIVFIPPFVDDAVFALNLSIKLGRVEISAFLEWHQLIRSIDRVSLEVLHFSKKCYSPGGAMTAGIFAFMPVLFREVASSLHPVSGRNSS